MGMKGGGLNGGRDKTFPVAHPFGCHTMLMLDVKALLK